MGDGPSADEEGALHRVASGIGVAVGDRDLLPREGAGGGGGDGGAGALVPVGGLQGRGREEQGAGELLCTATQQPRRNGSFSSRTGARRVPQCPLRRAQCNYTVKHITSLAGSP